MIAALLSSSLLLCILQCQGTEQKSVTCKDMTSDFRRRSTEQHSSAWAGDGRGKGVHVETDICIFRITKSLWPTSWTQLYLQRYCSAISRSSAKFSDWKKKPMHVLCKSVEKRCNPPPLFTFAHCVQTHSFLTLYKWFTFISSSWLIIIWLSPLRTDIFCCVYVSLCLLFNRIPQIFTCCMKSDGDLFWVFWRYFSSS